MPATSANPANTRRSVLRLICSPGGLAVGFVVLLVATCPGSRGDGAVELFLSQDGGLSGPMASASSTSIAVDPLTAAATAPVHRFADSGSQPFGRSKTPSERAKVDVPATGGRIDMFRRMRGTLPMLVAPLPGMTGLSTNLEPMTGASVGSNDIVVADTAR